MIHRHDVRCEWDSFCVVFFPVLYEAFYLIIGILIFCLSFSLKHCIRQRERKSKYHIICFSFCTFSFRIETTIIILWQKWQQDQRIKMKFNHLQLEVRLNLQFFFFIWEKFFSLKARPLPKTTTSIPMVSTGCKFEWFSLDSD
jgi:hypothetical protein